MSIRSTPVPALPSAQPMVTERLSDRLATHLMALIKSGALHAGDRLPAENQLAQVHGVSRTVVREAVSQLKSRGLLRSRQGSGVFVAEAAANRPLDFDPSVLDSMDAVLEVQELRRVIEGGMAALAAERATKAQLAQLRRQLRAIDEAVAEGRDGVAEDMAFHRGIGEASGNPQFGRLLGFLEQYLREAMRVTRANEARRADFMEQVRDEHRAIVDAIAARDPRAALLRATEHMLRGERRLEVGGIVRRRKPSTPGARVR
jgi:GntR family transcriptional regulator, transcriptional repressor for pyruvate dehydrogenase complex